MGVAPWVILLAITSCGCPGTVGSCLVYRGGGVEGGHAPTLGERGSDIYPPSPQH